MKVLYITSRSDMGGGPKHVYDLCSNIKGVDIYIASPTDKPFFKKYKELSRQHITIPHRKFSISSFLELVSFCKNNGISLVHSHGRGAGSYSRLMRFFGIRVIHTFHGVHYPKSKKEHLILMIERLLSLLTSKFISVSINEMKHAIDLKIGRANQIYVIPNGINIKKFSSVTSPNDPNVMGTLSRLDPHKNNIELIKFVEKMPEYKLLIAGDGEERDSLQHYINSKNLGNRIELLGQVQDPIKFLSSISIYVSASLGEGLPYAVLEAMASNKKILASDVSGHRDLLPSSSLYQLSQFEDFKSKLSSLNYESSKVIEEYSIDKMCTRVSSIYKSESH